MSPVHHRQKAGIFSNTFFRSSQGGWKETTGQRVEPRSMEKWTASHSQRVELESNRRTFPMSRVGETDICPEKVQNCLWTSDYYVIFILPLSKWEYLYRLFYSHFITIWWVCIDRADNFFFFCNVKVFGSEGASCKPVIDDNTLDFKLDAMTWDLEGSWGGSEYIFHVTVCQ